MKIQTLLDIICIILILLSTGLGILWKMPPTTWLVVGIINVVTISLIIVRRINDKGEA